MGWDGLMLCERVPVLRIWLGGRWGVSPGHCQSTSAASCAIPLLIPGCRDGRLPFMWSGLGGVFIIEKGGIAPNDGGSGEFCKSYW